MTHCSHAAYVYSSKRVTEFESEGPMVDHGEDAHIADRYGSGLPRWRGVRALVVARHTIVLIL